MDTKGREDANGLSNEDDNGNVTVDDNEDDNNSVAFEGEDRLSDDDDGNTNLLLSVFGNIVEKEGG
jgi:hypothetical protein